MDFKEFVKKRNNYIALKESFNNNDDFNKFVDKISELLGKHIKELIPLVGYIETTSNKINFLSKQYIVISDETNTSMFQLNWKLDSSDKELYSIDFFKNIEFAFNGKGKTDLTIYTNGSSVVYFMPIIWNIVNSKNYDLSQKEAIDYGKTIFKSESIKEYKIHYGTLQYHIIADSKEESVEDFFRKKRNELYDAMSKRNNSPEDKKLYNKLSDEFSTMYNAYKGGSAKTIGELELLIKKNVIVSQHQTEEEKKLENEFNNEKNEDPEIVFKKMDQYIKMVIKGLNPSVIICGAPGVGKTYRIKKTLKENNYIEGKNLFTIKGKCTPRRLYLALYEYKNKGDIIVIDDADSLVGPKAPEDCINILKGALDSTADPEGRLVTYGVAGKIADDEGNELPKRFYYKGSVIVITNYNAGSLDTALRGRSLMQDIHFTTEDVLTIIKRLMPQLSKDRVSMKSKIKAYDELVELNKKMEIEVSLRTFNICAVFFESIDDDELAKSMIYEQMKLQADRIKNKY